MTQETKNMSEHDKTESNAAVASPARFDLLGVFVTAKLKGKDDCRQGFLRSIEPLIIEGVSRRKYECEGGYVVVNNPPEDPVKFESFGVWLRFERAINKMTLQSVADKAGLSKSFIFEVEKGSEITVSNANKITNAFGLNLWQVLKKVNT